MLLLLTALISAAAPTEAKRSDLSKEESREVMRDFAKCMAKHHEKQARQIVEADPMGPQAGKMNKLMEPSCMPRRGLGLALWGKATHYRYAMAEALLLRRYRAGPPTGIAEAAPLDHPAKPLDAPMPADWPGNAAQWQENVAASQGNAYVSAFGECIVRAAPDASWALLKTEAASKEEQAAFAGLSAAMSGCVAKDSKVELNKFNVRGSIALNFYRMAAMTPSSVQEAAK